MKKGFTLIELLAVIVILAILALIVSPIISGVISDAKCAAAERSMECYAKAVELAQIEYQCKNRGSYAKTLSDLTINYSGNTVYTAMTTLDLGEEFDTSYVTDMSAMFCNTGCTKMTTLDLGPKFTKTASSNDLMFRNTGAENCIIKAHASIFKDINYFKVDDTHVISYTKGTIQSEY